MTSRVRIILVLLLAVALVSGGAWYLQRRGADESGAAALILHGNVDIRQVGLAFNGSERIARMMAEEGDRLAKGRVVAELETVRLEKAVDQAEARAEAQAATVAKLRAGPRPQEIGMLRAETEAAGHRAANAKRTAQRLDGLLARDLISQEQVDDARTAADAARAELRAANQVLELALAGTREEDIAGAEAQLRAYQADLALSRQRLEDAILRVPVDAVVEQRLLEPGDMASPQRPVYTLALTNPLWVRVYVREADLGRLRPGMRAEVHTDTYPGRAYPGWVGYISPTAEFTPKTVQTREVRTDLVYQVRVIVCNPRGELRLGMPATVTIPLDQGGAESPDPSSGCGNG